MKIVTLQCQFCQREMHGRKDKKFCSDICRVEFHNALNRDSSKFMANINKILRKNRRILEAFHKENITKVTKAQLLDEGFKFSYFTNLFHTKAGKTYYFIYEQGYIHLENNQYALVIKHEYID
jgi:hypothetical protein